MRFLLVSPQTEFRVRPLNVWTPLGLISIGASLKKEGHDVALLDRHALSLGTGPEKKRINEMLAEKVLSFKPDVIGFNTVSPLIHDTVECVSLIRPLFPGFMIAGGHHTTALPEESLRKIKGLNGVVAGEGEQALVQFAEGQDPCHIPGFWWKNPDGTIRHTPPVQIEPLDDLPFPDYSLLDRRFYLKRNHVTIRGFFLSSLSMTTSRGCVQRCEFCSESLTFGRGVRFHSPDYVMKGIRALLAKYPIDGIYFHDNDFLINRERAEKICEAILPIQSERRFQWSIQARADRIDRNIIRRLKKAGCVLIEIGVESSLQKNLDSIGKKTNIARIEEAIALCRDEGMSVHAYMITGLEGETIGILEKELAWMKRVKPHSFSWSPLEIHPGTTLYKRKGNRFFESQEWDRETVLRFYGQSPLSTVSPKEKRNWLKKHYVPYHLKTHLWNLFIKNYPRKFLPMLVMQGIREIRKLLDRIAKSRIV